MIIENAKALSSKQMYNALTIFKGVYDAEKLKSYNIGAVESWINNTALMHESLILFRSDSLGSLQESIFSNEEVRRFVYEINFRFFAICNETPNEDFLDSLVTSLINGLTIDGPYSIIPDRISNSLVGKIFQSLTKDKSFFKKKVTLREFLKSNKHLIIVLLIILINKPPSTD